jgi:Protein of unknown function (DUF3105)
VAKKPRTPPPPRKVQAPKQRHDPKTHNAERQKRLLYIFAGAGVVGLIVALVIVLSGGKTHDAAKSSDKTVAAAMKAAGCTFVTKPVLPPVHKGKTFHEDSPTDTTKVKWSTFPPSGGGHYPSWAIWAFYRDPVSPNRVVHNEEHGGVALWWGPKVPSATVDQLSSFYDQSPEGMIGTPIAGLGNKVAISAWTGDPSKYYKDGYFGVGHLATCPRFDEKAFATFRDAYRGHGPEGVPLSSDQPGTGPGA